MRKPNIPTLALSIRQPWAWAIIHAGKNIENRTWHTLYRGPVLVHASRGRSSPDEWTAAFALVRKFGCFTKTPPDFPQGGIIGQVEIVDCVTHSLSPWFGGPYGFVLRNPKPLPFRPCRGALGFFRP